MTKRLITYNQSSSGIHTCMCSESSLIVNSLRDQTEGDNPDLREEPESVFTDFDLDDLCSDGTCGKCVSTLLDGEVVYSQNPAFLTQNYMMDTDEKFVLTCKALPRSDIFLETVDSEDVKKYTDRFNRRS